MEREVHFWILKAIAKLSSLEVVPVSVPASSVGECQLARACHLLRIVPGWQVEAAFSDC